MKIDDTYLFLNKTKPAKKLNFKAHPDFEILAKTYDVTASNYFRRGIFYGAPSASFSDVISTLKKYFSKNENKKIKMLIAGIGESQEPFSNLAVIKDLTSPKPLRKSLELYTVDLQSKPDRKKLKKQSYTEDTCKPPFAENSFVKCESLWHGLSYLNKYRVTDDIFRYLRRTYNNSKRALWEKRLQEAVKEYPKDYFDIVSVNNTLIYLSGGEEVCSTLLDIVKTLKSGGALITDEIDWYHQVLGDCTREICPGIYIKN